MTHRLAVASAAAATSALALALTGAAPSQADHATIGIVTLQGDVKSGGTIAITLTADRGAITRVELTDVTLECSPNPGPAVFSPPVPVTDGDFSMGVFALFDETTGNVHLVDLMGSVDPAGAVSGSIDSVAGHIAIGPVIVCDGVEKPFTAATEMETPPGADDLLFAGAVEGGGTIALTARPEDLALTSLAITDVPLSDDCPSAYPLTMRAFVEPPALDTLSMPLWSPFSLDFNPTLLLGPLELAVSNHDQQTLEGTLSYCSTDAAWSAQLVPEPTPTATPTASPATITAPPSTATVAARALPPAGSGRKSGGAAAPYVAAVAVLAASALACIGGLAAWSRRMPS